MSGTRADKLVPVYDLGFLGGGQLARMSIHAAQRMGMSCFSLDPGDDTPASQVADAIQGRLDDPDAIAEVFRRCRRVTLENEFIPATAIASAIEVAKRDESSLMPGLETLATIQDKLRQREALNHAGVPSPNAAALVDPDTLLSRVIEGSDWEPVVMKARFGGYDGKGTRYGRTKEEFIENLPLPVEGWLVEEFVPFKRELAVMVFVGGGAKGAFRTMETVQVNHVCDLVYSCDVDASEVAIAAVEAFGGQGLFGVELFETHDGDILVNEIAPRPHNTGHYSLDWGGTSQFEQHVRLAMGLPVDREPFGRTACMANLLGVDGAFDLHEATRRALEYPDVHVHWYGKSMRKGRKMGHLTAVGGEDVRERAIAAREAFFNL